MRRKINMQLRDKADVLFPDGSKVGDVERVVLDPHSDEVSHIVVGKGLLLSEERVLPIEVIDRTENGRVVLKESVEDIDSFPKFEEENYLKIEQEATTRGKPSSFSRPYYWYPPSSLLDWTDTTYIPDGATSYVKATERNIPSGYVALEEGAKVFSSDGDYVGDIEEIILEPDGERAVQVLISKGIFFKERKLIPTIWFRSVMEEEVHLAVSTDTLQRLPEVE
jgi:uncharacterized protein YrrD